MCRRWHSEYLPLIRLSTWSYSSSLNRSISFWKKLFSKSVQNNLWVCSRIIFCCLSISSHSIPALIAIDPISPRSSNSVSNLFEFSSVLACCWPANAMRCDCFNSSPRKSERQLHPSHPLNSKFFQYSCPEDTQFSIKDHYAYSTSHN